MKSLKSILLGTALSVASLFPTSAKDWIVGEYRWNGSVMSYNYSPQELADTISQAEDNDRIIIKGYSTEYSGSYSINKSLTFTGEEGVDDWFVADKITTSGNAKVSFENFDNIYQPIFDQHIGADNSTVIPHYLFTSTDSSSVSIFNSEVMLDHGTTGLMNWQSTGKTDVKKSEINAIYSPLRLPNGTNADYNLINVEVAKGKINLSESRFMCNGAGAIIDYKQSIGTGVTPNELNLLNNNFSNCFGIQFQTIGFMTTGEIANNNFLNNYIDNDDVAFDGLDRMKNPALKVQKNNFWNVKTKYKKSDGTSYSTLSDLNLVGFGDMSTLEQTLLVDGYGNIQYVTLGEDYEFNPLWTDATSLSYRPDSPLWYKGQYINGLTTWFPSPEQTWIGNTLIEGNAPWEIPEVPPVILISGGLGYLFSRRKYEEKTPKKE